MNSANRTEITVSKKLLKNTPILMLFTLETQEVILEDENIVFMEKGRIVNESFRVVMPDGTQKTKNESVYPVSNYEHEEFENEKKRYLLLPTPPIVELMLTDMQSKLLMHHILN